MPRLRLVASFPCCPFCVESTKCVQASVCGVSYPLSWLWYMSLCSFFAIRIVVRSRDHSQRWLSLPVCILCKCKFDDKSILFIRFHAVRLAGSALLISNDFPRWASPAYHLMPILCYALHTCSVWALVACTAYLINTT